MSLLEVRSTIIPKSLLALLETSGLKLLATLTASRILSSRIPLFGVPAPQVVARSTRLLSLQVCELTIIGASLLFFLRILLLVWPSFSALLALPLLLSLLSQEQGAAVDMDAPSFAEIAVVHLFLIVFALALLAGFLEVFGCDVTDS
jgi:hypothetical protein